MGLPAADTKGASAMGRSNSTYQRKSISFDMKYFEQLARYIENVLMLVLKLIQRNFIHP
jgi:hypothetical protein